MNVYVGDQFTLRFDGYCDYQTTVSDSSILERGSARYSNGNTIIDFTAKKAGTTTIKCEKYDPDPITLNEPNPITVNVIKQPLYVRTAINDRDIDRINEWLEITGVQEHEDGYVPNCLKNGHFRPYHLTVGDTLEIYTPEEDWQNLSLFVQGLELNRTANGNIYYKGVYDNDLLETLSTDSPAGTVGATYKALKPGYAQILVIDGSKVIRTMYIEIEDTKGRMLDHADIEIADGGKYTMSKVTRKADGTIEKTIRVYDSYVNDIHESILYHSEDDSQTCQFYQKNDGTLPYPPERHGYLAEDYWVDPDIEPGSPQYELTSKYDLDTGYYSNKWFYVGEVDHVVFDVDIALKPLEERKYVKDGDNWVLQSTTDISSGQTEIKPAKYRMDHRDVIDAYNKCPDHSGLDFTIMASSAMIELEVTKTMAGRHVEEGDFTFELVEKVGENDYKVISTAQNNADGLITFESMHFEKPGELTYYVREVNDGKFDDVEYSTEMLEIKIKVTSINYQTGEMLAEIISPSDMNFNITNYRKYTLPETGGTGTVPYTIFGTAMIITASTLYLRKRRKLSASDRSE